MAIQSASAWLYGWVPGLAPNVLTNPAGQSVGAGQGAVFSVSATGVPDPACQWYKDGSLISGATNATYAIASAVRTDAGSYTVVVSNASGTVTSSAAVLTYSGNVAPQAGPAFSIGALTGVPVTVAIVGGKYPPTDADGDALTVTGVVGATNGTVTTDGTNATYTATNGTADSFTYTVSDGNGGTASQTIGVTITTPGQGYNQLSLAAPGNGTNILTYLGIPNYNYALDLATNLAPPVNWMPQITNPAANNGVLRFTNVTALPQVYYRSRHVP